MVVTEQNTCKKSKIRENLNWLTKLNDQLKLSIELLINNVHSGNPQQTISVAKRSEETMVQAGTKLR